MGLCKKPSAFHLAAQAAKCYFKQTSFSLILRSKINENDVCLKFYFAAVGGGTLFTQPLFKTTFVGVNRQRTASGLFTQPQK